VPLTYTNDCSAPLSSVHIDWVVALSEVIVILDAAVPPVNATLLVVLYTAPDELLANVRVLFAVEQIRFPQVQPAEPVKVRFPSAPNVKLPDKSKDDDKVMVLGPSAEVNPPHNTVFVLKVGVAFADKLIVDPDAIIVPPVELLIIVWVP